jgi:hypothetical protein
MTTTSPIYVASSWRNPHYDSVLASIRAGGFECYDFKNPQPGDHGFHWSDVGGPDWRQADGAEFKAMLRHPIAAAGFDSDMGALRRARIVVLVLPCNRSAHLELGYAVGAGKHTAVLLDETFEPELMYRMVEKIATDVDDLLAWLQWR